MEGSLDMIINEGLIETITPVPRRREFHEYNWRGVQKRQLRTEALLARARQPQVRSRHSPAVPARPTLRSHQKTQR